MEVQALLHKGRIEVSEFNTKVINQCVADNDGKPVRAWITSNQPESSKVRRYVHGCLIPLIIFMDGNENNKENCDRYFEFLKRELSPEVLKINGKVEVFGKSTKGSKVLNKFAEKLQDYLSEQYGVSHDNKAINPDEYKRFMEIIFPYQMEYESYLDYCLKMKWITKPI